MFKRISTVFAFAVLCLSSLQVSAQSHIIIGSSNNITKNVEVKPFTHLKLEGSLDVVYTMITVGEPRVEFYGPDNIVEVLKATHDGQTLLIHYPSDMRFKKQGKLVARVFAPAPEKFTIVGSGDIQIPKGVSISESLSFNVSGSGDITGKSISSKDLQINVEGSGDVELTAVSVNNVTASVSGSGDIKLSGKTSKAVYTVVGAGDIDAKKLVADNVNVTVTGSGDVSCNAVNTLSGKVSGSGEIKYTGNPEVSLVNNRKGTKRL